MAYLGSTSRSPLLPTALSEGSISSPLAYHRQDKASLPAGSPGSPLSMAQVLAAKRRHAGYYSHREQGKCGSPRVVTPVAVRHQALAGANLSPQAGSPTTGVAVAVPKPVYAHNACCTDSCCTAGHSYAVEPGLRRTPTHLYEDEWLMGYGAVPLPPQRKDVEMGPELRSRHPEPGGAKGVSGKEVAAEECCGMDAHLSRRVSTAYSDISHSGYTCVPPGGASFIGVPPESCQRLQFPPRDYPGFPAPHPQMFGPAALAQCGVPRKVYPGYSYAPKYVQVPQRLRAYYSQNHVEAEKATACGRDIYSKGMSSPSPPSSVSPRTPPAHCSLSPLLPPLMSSTPAPCHMRLPRHHFLPRGFDHPAFRPYQRFNGGHPKLVPVRAPPYPPLAHQNTDKPLDYSMHRAQPTWSPRRVSVPYGVPEMVPSKPVRLEDRSLHHVTGEKTPQGHAVGVRGECDVAEQKVLSDASEQKVHHADSPAQSNRKRKPDTKNNKKDNVDDDDDEDDDVFEVEVTNKKHKLSLDHLKASASPQPMASPPMPVIHQVFSLAPYKLYLEAAGVLPAGKQPKNSDEPQAPAGPSPKPKHSPEKALKSEGCHSLDSNSLTRKTRDIVSVKPESVDFPKKEETTRSPDCEEKFKSELRHAYASSRVIELNFSPETDLEVKNCSELAASKCKVEGTLERRAESTPSSTKNVHDVTPLPKPALMPSAVPPAAPSLKGQAVLLSPPKNPVRLQNLQNIPPQCLKLSTYNIVVPEVLRKPVPILNQNPSLNPNPHLLPGAPQCPAEPTSEASQARQARHQFMEMHQSLCKLIYTFATQTSPQEHREWLSSMQLGKTSYPPDKHQKVSCLAGPKAREVWARAREMNLLLQRVLALLKGYQAHGECPFPHVTRAGGGIFVPMLVLKEGLFPQVQGAFVDQVLQEHRVELRPTTLSEEKLLTQLHRRPCSSKLRRLLSLRHLPEVYTDVLNLFYYTCVCKVLGDVLVCISSVTQSRNTISCSSADVASNVPTMTEPEGSSGETDTLENSPHFCRSAGPTSDPTSSLREPEGSRFTVKEEPEERDIDAPSGTVAGELHSLHREELENMEVSENMVKLENVELSENMVKLENMELSENMVKLENVELSKNMVKLQNVELSKNMVKLENVEVSENMVKLEDMEGWESLEEELENLQEPERWTIVNSVAGGEEEVAWEVVSGVVCSTHSVEGLNIKVEVVPDEEQRTEEGKEEEEEEEVVVVKEKEKREEAAESPWGCPMSSDDEMSSGDSGPDTDSVYTPSRRSSSSSSSSSSASSSPKTQGPPRSRSRGVVLKLRKVSSSEAGHGRETLYQAVSDLTEPSLARRKGEAGKGRPHDRQKRWKRIRGNPQKHDKDQEHKRERDEGRARGKGRERDKDRDRERERRRRREKKKRRKERSRSRRRARRERRRKRLLRARTFSPPPPSADRASHRRALPKIRYCPYLSTCHRSDRRRRWVLRSAVQSARRAMLGSLPDLVGKRIRHLYEEKDKSEVWYRGTVLRVHETHPNPLKTVFEVKYDSEPEWQYYLELLLDYQKGWLRVEDF
ncbi:hypothetical protein ACEWY4_010563 [Coilia grayii]|uniref:Rhodanese domain-containing protein n=1 Tax=Coilia grayii TaxID=363190 RepID=A0ABD1K289_9TELE